MEETKKRNFFTHVFDFDDDSRHEMLNIAQYAVLATVLVALLNKLFELYMPEPEKDKGAPALALETMLQIILTFVGLVFIHRIIECIPTFSGQKYGTYNMIPVILPVLVVLLSLNSGVGRKVAMLFDKFSPNKPPPKQQQQQGGAVSPPIAQFNQLLPQGMNTSNPMKAQSAIPGPQADPDYSGMFGASNDFEPVAANLGGVSLF
jgi:hypothetical protein